MNFIKKLFQKPSARTLAQIELEEAQRELLHAQSARDYATCMVEYHTTRVARLEAILRSVA